MLRTNPCTFKPAAAKGD